MAGRRGRAGPASRSSACARQSGPTCSPQLAGRAASGRNSLSMHKSSSRHRRSTCRVLVGCPRPQPVRHTPPPHLLLVDFLICELLGRRTISKLGIWILFAVPAGKKRALGRLLWTRPRRNKGTKPECTCMRLMRGAKHMIIYHGVSSERLSATAWGTRRHLEHRSPAGRGEGQRGRKQGVHRLPSYINQPFNTASDRPCALTTHIEPSYRQIRQPSWSKPLFRPAAFLFCHILVIRSRGCARRAGAGHARAGVRQHVVG